MTAEEILERTGALLTDDHFVYISGQHGSGWIGWTRGRATTARSARAASR